MFSVISKANIDKIINVSIVIENSGLYTFLKIVNEFLIYILDLLSIGLSVEITLITSYPKIYTRNITLNSIKINDVDIEVNIYQNIHKLMSLFDKIIHKKTKKTFIVDQDVLKSNVEKSLETTNKKLLIIVSVDCEINFNPADGINSIYFHKIKNPINSDVKVKVDRENLFLCDVSKVISYISNLAELDVKPINTGIFKTIHFGEKLFEINSPNLLVHVSNNLDLSFECFSKIDCSYKLSEIELIILYQYYVLLDLFYILSLSRENFDQKCFDIYNKMIQNTRSLQKYRVSSPSSSSKEIFLENKILSTLVNCIIKISCDIDIKFSASRHQFQQTSLSRLFESQQFEFDIQNMNAWEKTLYHQLCGLEVKSAVQSLQVFKKNKSNQTNHSAINIVKLVNSALALISDYLEDAESKYVENISYPNEGFYRSVITMSEWFDEIHEGGCTGLALILRKGNIVREKYNINMISHHMNIATSNELLCTLQISSNEDRSNISVTNNRLLSAFNSLDANVNNSTYNFMIPLYIHHTHWEVAKIYLKHLSSIALYDSLKIHDENAWKIIYMIFMNVGSFTIDEKCTTNTIKYMFSLWLTINVTSKENKYDKSINFLVNKICSEQLNEKWDCCMLMGQLLSVGTCCDELLLKFAKKYYMFHEPECSMLSSESPDMTTFIQDVKTENKFLINSLRFSFTLKHFFDSIKPSLCAMLLKRSYGIPEEDMIKKFVECRDEMKENIDKKIDLIITTSEDDAKKQTIKN